MEIFLFVNVFDIIDTICKIKGVAIAIIWKIFDSGYHTHAHTHTSKLSTTITLMHFCAMSSLRWQ